MAQTFMRENKCLLIEALSLDPSLILQYVQEHKLVTDREYDQIYGLLKLSQTKEGVVIDLIDLLRRKGDEKITARFLDLLQNTPNIIDHMPKLRTLGWAGVPPEVPQCTSPESKTGNCKTRKMDFFGYIHNVSEIRRGKNKQYFTAVVMEENNRWTFIVFPIQLRGRFVNAERTRTPVKLENLMFRPDYKFNRIFNERSTFSILKNSLFENNSDLKPKDTSLNLASLEVYKGNKENWGINKVNIIVQVIQKLQEGHCKTKAQKCIPMKKYLVGDIVANVTTHADLVVWCPKYTTETGKWYRVTNVSGGWYNDQLILNTTQQSAIVNVPSGGECNVPPDMIQRHDFNGKIIGHWLSEIHTCPQGHPLERESLSGKRVTCKMCPMAYIPSTVKTIITGKLSIQSEVDLREFSVGDSVIRKVLGRQGEGSMPVNKVEDALVGLPPVTVTVLNDNVLSITALTEGVATHNSSSMVVRQLRF
ncbi:hypothetical protein DPEC_G00154270 [Dallia pectoralis]|uniref:Uncharacterized protein n=1 Tax=Dallia pectoralis TaxID=75939 RepID=A0ACC2GKB7_DALPE|nr:hypothetical protein DPEC_G00154270 [Dallia pectoralis]